MEKYERLDLEVLGFEACDVITASVPEVPGETVED